MTKHFLIYGVLLFLLFEKACDIFIALVKIINENQDLSNSIIYIMLGFSVIIPTILFFFFLKKLKFNYKNLILLVIIYILSFIMLYLLNKQIGVIMVDNFELNKKINLLDIEVFGWSKTFMITAKIIVLTTLSIRAFKGLNKNLGT